ncbi:NAD(P)-dependent oxidoreductase [Actinorhabdospora filicis]|uniref:dTDP-4-dehydrorhamnose reductase n=1 Tax=Actinorhabdospora filicis TaxID=1785913 RepID=A0A9W6SR66_9ACTN|nr:dTDP-4-dehydrorhamnose reductase [Actinorhabdospora filicis]GLZ79241.1 NAD(P)-dependent oxidoreductase [Actinorhabdospora filicis]
MSGAWAVTGAAGMLGRDVLARLAGAGVPATPLTRAGLDVTDPGAVSELIGRLRPSVLVNCAAWTAVDAAETDEGAAHAVNAGAARHLAAACAATGAVMLHVSTDYVFDGTARTPYAEDAPTAPRSAYGRTKLAGELAVRELLPERGLIVRTAWLYGAGGPNFARTMLDLEATRDTVSVVDDQRGQPTWTADLADRLVRLGLAARDGHAPPGVYHGTGSGDTTWYGFAREIFRLAGADPGRVRPTTTDRFPRPAPRPAYSVLGHDRWAATGVPPVRDWREALAEAFPQLLAAARPAAPS